jgi:hypothetical protein
VFCVFRHIVWVHLKPSKIISSVFPSGANTYSLFRKMPIPWWDSKAQKRDTESGTGRIHTERRSKEALIGIVFTKPQKSTFERTTVFNRNYVESYAARKAHAKIMGQPPRKRTWPSNCLKRWGSKLPVSHQQSTNGGQDHQSLWNRHQ